ncbi:MAG: histidine kinase [Clostridiaceae bacterium]
MFINRIPLKNSIFVRLLLTFVFVLTPLLMFGFGIYDWGLKTVRRDIVRSMQAQTDFFRDNFENEIQRIKVLQLSIVNDASLNSVIMGHSMDIFDTNAELNRIQQKIEVIKSSSRYISEVKILIPSLEKTITSTSILNMKDSEKELLTELSMVSDTRINYRNGEVFLNVISPFDAKLAARTPDYDILIILSANEIEKSLQELLIYERSGSFILGSLPDFRIFTGADNAISEEIIKIQHSISSLSKDADGTRDGISKKIGGKKYLITLSSMDQLGLTLFHYMPEEQVFEKVNRFRSMFYYYAITAIIIIVIFSLSTYRLIYRPLFKLNRAFEQVGTGDMSVELQHKHKDEFKSIYKGFNTMVSNLNTLIEQVYKQKIRMQKSELKQLQSQINPHFLYNSFFILNSMSRTGNYDSLESFTEQLGEYFQFMTRNAADEVPLCREVKHARVYTEIQILRFSNRIKAEFDDLPEQYCSFPVPRLILQPIIENAFKHSLEKKLENGLLSIRFIISEANLCIMVEDNGDSMSDMELDHLNASLSNQDDIQETTGIINIHRRLQIKFGNESGLCFMRGKLGGLKAVLKIPISSEEFNVQTSDC